jgi:hypothetical protein
MKSLTLVSALLVGLSACATGSIADDSLDLGVGAPDGGSDASTVVIIGSGQGSSAGQPAPASVTPSGEDAGSPSNGAGSGDDAGGFGGGGGFDAGGGAFNEGFDAGGDDYDAGFGGLDDYDAGGYGGYGGYDAGGGGGGSTCDGYASPDEYANCNCTASDPNDCQNNGCYGGYWCKLSTGGCHANPPSGC